VFHRVYALSFADLSTAKLAAGFFAEKIGEDASRLGMEHVDVQIDAEGGVVVMASFNKVSGVKRFEKFGDMLVEELRNSCPCKSSKFSTITTFRYNAKTTETA